MNQRICSHRLSSYSVLARDVLVVGADPRVDGGCVYTFWH